METEQGKILAHLGALMSEVECMGLAVSGDDAADAAVAVEIAQTAFANNLGLLSHLSPGDCADVVSDFICDLLLYSSRRGLDTDAILSQSQMNYQAEMQG